MALRTAQVAVTTATTELTDGLGHMDGSAVLLKATVADVYIGPADVTTGTGFLIAAGEVLGWDLENGERLYARTSTGTATVYVMRTGV